MHFTANMLIVIAKNHYGFPCSESLILSLKSLVQRSEGWVGEKSGREGKNKQVHTQR